MKFKPDDVVYVLDSEGRVSKAEVVVATVEVKRGGTFESYIVDHFGSGKPHRYPANKVFSDPTDAFKEVMP